MYASQDPEKVNPNSYSVLCFASKMPMILISTNYKIRFASRQMKGMHKKVENMRNRRSLQGNLQVTLDQGSITVQAIESSTVLDRM